MNKLGYKVKVSWRYYEQTWIQSKRSAGVIMNKLGYKVKVSWWYYEQTWIQGKKVDHAALSVRIFPLWWMNLSLRDTVPAIQEVLRKTALLGEKWDLMEGTERGEDSM